MAWCKYHQKLLTPPGGSTGQTFERSNGGGGGSGGYWAWAQGLALQTRGHYQEAQDVYQEALSSATGRCVAFALGPGVHCGSGLGFRVEGLSEQVSGLGFRVQGFGLGVGV